MEKTREEFIIFIRQAMNDEKSSAREELYTFLVACFTRADTDMNGRLQIEAFDTLVDEAAELPRRYGYAPKSEEMYASPAMRKAARAKMFTEMDTDKVGYITLGNWISFALDHIRGKINQLPKDYVGGTSKDVSKDEFVTFIRQAVNTGTAEYRELYYFLLKNFQSGDVKKNGLVDPVAFDLMIEDAAQAPRRFGLAPKASNLYRSDEARLEARKKIFATMDLDNNGVISFDEWLDYALKHIKGKVAGL